MSTEERERLKREAIDVEYYLVLDEKNELKREYKELSVKYNRALELNAKLAGEVKRLREKMELLARIMRSLTETALMRPPEETAKGSE